MARLFGMISQDVVDITFSLSEEPSIQSNVQGWGTAWYDMQRRPTVQKGKRSVLYPDQNQPVHISVMTDVFISHARFATSGAVTTQNAHPFQFSHYVFAHSGTIRKELLLEKLIPPMNQNFQSEPIDSEVLFRYILQTIKEKGIIDGIKDAIRTANDPRGTNFILTDGATLYAYCYGLPLYYLKRHAETPLHTLSQETSIAIGSNDLAHNPCFLVSSEKLTNENWTAFDDHELLTVHRTLQYDAIKIL